MIDLWDSEVGGNAVGAAVLVIELADSLGRAVSSKLFGDLVKISIESHFSKVNLPPIDQQCCTLAIPDHWEGRHR